MFSSHKNVSTKGEKHDERRLRGSEINIRMDVRTEDRNEESQVANEVDLIYTEKVIYE